MQWLTAETGRPLAKQDYAYSCSPLWVYTSKASWQARALVAIQPRALSPHQHFTSVGVGDPLVHM